MSLLMRKSRAQIGCDLVAAWEAFEDVMIRAAELETMDRSTIEDSYMKGSHMRAATKYRLKCWAIRHWLLISIGVGEFFFLSFWVPVWLIKPDEAQAIAVGAALCGAAWTGLYLRIRPPYGKSATWRQARFTPGNQ